MAFPPTAPSQSGPSMLDGNPPPAARNPTFGAMAGGPPSPQGMSGGYSPGMSQIAASAVRMAMEIDQALKVLAQQVPTLLPWVMQTTMELKQQLGQALSSGAVPTGPGPMGNDAAAFPDGGGHL